MAEKLDELGEAHGVRTSALKTDMDTPLGRAAGNALEVTEAVEMLEGGGPPDVVDVTLALAREMLGLVGLDEVDPAAALADGQAMTRWRAMVAAQGGDPDAPLAVANERETVTADRDGYVRRLDALSVGLAAWRLGAGRARKEDPVSATAGVLCLATVGDRVSQGQPLLELHADDPSRFAPALADLEGAVEIGPDPPPARRVVIDRIT
jgi:thymidine phosphorylase